MKTARIVVLAIALSAGGVAAYLASGSDNSTVVPSRRYNCRRSMFWWQRRILRLGKPWPGRRAMADMAGCDREQQLHSPQRSPGRDHPDCRIDRAVAVHRGRTHPRTEAGQGQRLGIHGGGIAGRHACGFDRNFPGNRRWRLYSAQRPGRRDPVETREEYGVGRRHSSLPRSFWAISAFSPSIRPHGKRMARIRSSARPLRLN